MIILTEWNQFRALDLARIAHCMAQAVMADLRNVYDEKTALAAGFAKYEGGGR